MATKIVNQYRKAKAIAEVMVAAEFDVSTAATLRPELREIVANINGWDTISDETWSLVVELLETP